MVHATIVSQKMNAPVKQFRRATIILLFTVLIGLALFRLTPPDFRGHRLWRAAWDGDRVRVRLLLMLGAPVNHSTGSGTALHAAAAQGDVKLMKLLLAHGAAVDKEAKFGETPLYEARSNSHPEAEKLLLLHGANPDTSRISPP